MKYTPPGEPVSSGTRARPGVPKAVIIEIALRSYINLSCGHLTSRETQDAYSAYRPNNRKFFCENCGSWEDRKPVAKRIEPPEDPLF